MEQGLVRADRASTVTATRMRSSFLSVVPAIASLRGVLVGLGGALTVRQVLGYAEAYTIVQNQLRVAGVESQNLAAATEEIFDIATRTRTPVEQMAELYSRVSVAASELGISQQEAFQFTELVGQSIAIAGASSAAATGALTQLSQAIGGTVLQAQELNSIMDGARPIIVAAANGMDEAGGSVARFRQLVLDGKVTAQEFFEAIMRGSESISEPFERAVIRPSQALQNLRTAIIETIGEMDTASGSSAGLAAAINDLAEAVSSDAFQEGAVVFAADLVDGLNASVVLASELNTWVGTLTGGFANLGDVIRLPAQQFKFMVDQIARLAGATAAPDTSLEAMVPPEILQRLQAQGTGQPLEVDISGGKLQPTTGAARKATFEDILGPAQERLELLRETELSEARISEIVAAQGRLKRDLSAVEREALIEVNAALDLEEERRDISAEMATLRAQAAAGGRETEALRVQVAYLEDLAEGGREYADALRSARQEQERARSEAASTAAQTDLKDQIADLNLIAQFGGRETEEYRRQNAELLLKRELGKEVVGLSKEELRLVMAATQAETRARVSRATTEIRQRTERAQFETGQAPVAGTFDILGLPPQREFFAEQEQFRLQQEGTYNVNMEPWIQDMARAQQHLELMTETAPELAHTLAELGQIAAFEGLEETGEAFLGMLAQMTFELLAFQLIMSTLGIFGVGAPTLGAGLSPAGRGLGASGWGGPRQHGGPVRPDQAYLVGEAGTEMFVPASAGKIVSNPDTTRMLSRGGDGGGDITVNARPQIHIINNAPNTRVSQEEQGGGEEGAGPRIDVIIDEVVSGNLRPGTATSRALRDRFGLQFQTRR